MSNIVSPYSPIGDIPPRTIDNPVFRTAAWVIIIASVALIVGLNWFDSRQVKHAASTATAPPPMQVEITGRYVVGIHALLSQYGQADPSAETMVNQVEQSGKSPGEKLAAVVIAGELLGKDQALQRLKALTPPPARQGNPARDASFDLPADALRRIYTSGPQSLTGQQRDILVRQLGWFGKLAESYGKPDGDPERAALLAAARRAAVAIIAMVVTVGAAGLAGFVLLVLFLVRLKDGKVRTNYHPQSGGDVFLEAFAIYLGGMSAVFLVAPHLPGIFSRSLAARIALMIAPTFVAIAWPIVRGAGPGVWRYGLGWHAGRGVFREIGMGLVSYVAGLPVLAVGVIVSLQLIRLSGATPSHPIEHMIGNGPGLTLLAVMLACVYAPITEETMFRGALFHALRGRHRWLFSAVVSAFIFAAIHPQGWTLIPTLMSIAIVFAGIREWRGTILSSAAAHCAHNTLLLSMLLLASG